MVPVEVLSQALHELVGVAVDVDGHGGNANPVKNTNSALRARVILPLSGQYEAVFHHVRDATAFGRSLGSSHPT